MVRLLTALLVTTGLAATATAHNPIGVHYGGGPTKLSREVAARKAVAGMAAEKFAFAEVTPDGHARGWSDKAAVLVLCMQSPDPEQVQFMVLAASTDDAEAARLRNAVRTHIVEGKDDPKSPKRVAPADGKVPPAPVSCFVKSEDRAASPILKHFGPVASLVMEKMGMATKPDSHVLVLGNGPSVMCIVLVGPTPNALNLTFNAVTVTHGEKPAEKLAADVLDRVVKILYE